MIHFRKLSLTLVSLGLLVTLGGCGGGSGSNTPTNPYTPSLNDPCTPGSDVIGTWKVVANNSTIMPDSPFLPYFSYNQPSVNTNGIVVFRGRAKSSTSGAGEIQRGIYATSACQTTGIIYTVADTLTTQVPAPNNTSATFNEFPSIPRIDANSGLIATRGQSAPVWSYTDPTTGLDTQVGTAGLYVTLPTGLSTGIGILGNVPEFSYMQVPDASTTGIKFDQFPGSPTVTGNKYLLFKGNYTDGVSKTGVFYRDLSVPNSPVTTIANSDTVIPGQTTTSVTFGSTAPPSAQAGKVVFVGLDNEDAPTMGGIYMAPIADKPALDPLVTIGALVPDKTGAALGTQTFTQIGEALAFDGRYVAFWGAWGQDFATHGGMHQITLTCPTDGSQALQAACMAGSIKDPVTGDPTGEYHEYEPINQGIFVVDSQTHKVWMVAQGEYGYSGVLGGGAPQFQGFQYWVYSGSTKGGDAEPPKWRASAFAALDGSRGVLFKGSPLASTVSGIYGVPFDGSTLGTTFKVIATGDPMTTLDPSAPAGPITSVAIEREGLRNGWLTITAASADWAGAYATYFPGPFQLAGTPDSNGIDNLILG